MDKFSYTPKQLRVSTPQKREVPGSDSDAAHYQDTSDAQLEDECDYSQLCDFLLDNSPASKSSDEDLPFISMGGTHQRPTAMATVHNAGTTTTVNSSHGKPLTTIPEDTSCIFASMKNSQQREPSSITGPQCRSNVTFNGIGFSSHPCSSQQMTSYQKTASNRTLDIPRRTGLMSIPGRTPLDPIHPIGNASKIYPAPSAQWKLPLKKQSENDGNYLHQKQNETSKQSFVTCKQASQYNSTLPCAQYSAQQCHRYANFSLLVPSLNSFSYLKI